MTEMTVSDWIMIAAVLLGPIIAVRLTRYLDDQKERRSGKANIFKTLMATRARNVSWAHVEALNRIDLEFSKRNNKEREVLDAWKMYLDFLSNSQLKDEAWATKRVELLIELLHKMARVLKYDFDKTHIKNSCYFPEVHGEIEKEQFALRKNMLEVLNGVRPLPISITNVGQN
ncbi:hypothetical protein HZU75_01135 [Chitinibacter fontanus]|uniref:DUF6680 domain-containing protein n=1 Tax=Chitinibacter fontanus TaxID=1737446 RepID=A0A7D5ZD07_9NEIS|nr:DUF6680 family protein [Chitinibacter fontanus]QLI80248.1 hypothetical protein HZU75_01135 [Chitinibacter fontanus]